MGSSGYAEGEVPESHLLQTREPGKAMMKFGPGVMVMENQGRPLGQATWSPEAEDSEALISAARNDGFWLDTGVTSHSYSET